MFIGHFAPAFAARAITSEAPKLGTLFVAAQLVDWAFFMLFLGGVEHMRLDPGITAMNPFDFYDYPITHSLVGTLAFATVFGVLVGVLTRNTIAAIWAGIVVASHWALDWISHRPDLTIAGGEETFGLGLWNFPIAAMAIELALIGLAFWWFMARTKGPVVPPVALFLTLLVFQTINWFGPEPTSLGAPFVLMALFAFAILTALAFWVSSTRWHRNELGLGVASPPI